MDYTGGDRTVSTVIIALTKMLEERGIHIDHIWAIRENRFSKKNYNNYREEYAYINYYVWQEVDKMAELAGCGTDISGKADFGEKKADRITEYIFSSPSPYTQIKAGLRKNDLKDLLKNYMAFKTEIRHSLNHAAGKFPLKKIQSSIVWMNTGTMSRAFSENSGMTTELLAQILRDLLEQLNHILDT